MRRRRVAVLGLILLVGLALFLLLGSLRYGSPQALVRRMRTELELQRRPEVLYVPTALPTVRSVAEGQPTSAPRPTPTPGPISQPTGGPAPTLTDVPLHREAADSVELTGFRHEWQTWNNCGPATLSMLLSHFGSTATQADGRVAIRPNPEDKHASPEELAEFARAQGYEAIVRVNGTPEIVKLFLSNGLPVMMPTWHEDKPGDGMGHYRLITGYDDAAGEWIIHDSLAPEGVDLRAPYVPARMPYDEFYALWRVANFRYLVVYTAPDEAVVRSILGPDADDAAMWERSLQRARQDVEAHPEDAFARFNLGSNLVAVGQYEEAAAAYDEARRLGLPWRMLWYQFGPVIAYYEVGRYDEVVALADATLAMTTHVEELHYWRAMGLLALGERERALGALRTAVALRPHYHQAAEALAALEGREGG